MKTAVIGSRDFTDYNFLRDTLDKYEITEVVSGGAKGADRLSEVYADERNLPKLIYYADWATHGKSAGIRRNYDIINASEQVIAFWDGKSKGTKHSIDYAESLGKPTLVVTDWEKDKTFNWSWDNPLFENIKPKIPPLVIG